MQLKSGAGRCHRVVEYEDAVVGGEVEPGGGLHARLSAARVKQLRRIDCPLPSYDSRDGDVVDRRTAIGWPEVWAVIKASAERRLGKPLLKVYLFLALFGIVVVLVCIVIMHL